MASALLNTANFIHAHIQEDLGEDTHKIHTRFPPEPNGHLHIGHAKAICINHGLARLYGGRFNLRFDDTNPTTEDKEYVESIKNDVEWLGYDWDELRFASDYFEEFYNIAIRLIEKGVAFVCDMTAQEVQSYRGTLSAPGRPSPFRDRSPEESLDLFRRMRSGEFPDGSRTLRAKIDMASPNINMRDPVLYRIIHAQHHNTGDSWCIYPTYDYAHPLEDAIEGITHSLCSLEFEDHRPLYDWCISQAEFPKPPRQIEFAKLRLTNTIMGKRYIRALVDSGELDGWDDPRLPTLAGMRRRGYPAAAIRAFCESVGVSKAYSMVDIAQLEHHVREELKPTSPVLMGVINPLKLIITNYPKDSFEEISLENHPEAELGSRKTPFGRELYIEMEDFMEEPPSKFHRLKPGGEVRLKGAYIVRCTGTVKDADGNILEVHAEYEPESRSGMGTPQSSRRVKGTIHWVCAVHAIEASVRMLEPLAFDDPEADGGYTPNPNSQTIVSAKLERHALQYDTPIQLMRQGYIVRDTRSDTYNMVVALKSSYKGGS